ncbi:MAG: SHOCT domain-containing protein, partial [Promethearchaeota archaeon]
LWFVLVILPWIGLIFLIVYLVIREEAFESKKTLTDAHKILDERYAKGEISREEYLQGKKDLSAKTEEDKET